MKLKELIEQLMQIEEKAGGDIPVEIDHRFFDTTLDIEEVVLGETYVGPRLPVVYIYTDNTDTEGLLERLEVA